MATYPPNIPSPISAPPSRIPTLLGNYVSLEEMPFSLKKLILNTEKIVVLRESSTTDKITGDYGGGRTTGTMWYKGEVIGFTVEDAIREEKIMHVTAIPDTTPPSLAGLLEDELPEEYYQDPAALPPSIYNLELAGTNSDFIGKTLVNGEGLIISSKNDPGSRTIYTEDVNAQPGFSPRVVGGREIAFDGVFVHHGGSENASSGCLIFGTQRKGDGKVSSSPKEVIALNKYLQNEGVVGKGKVENLVILDLNKIPKDIPRIGGEIIDGTTGRPVPGTEINIELEVLSSQEVLKKITPTQENKIIPPVSEGEYIKEQTEGMSKKEARKYVKKVQKFGAGNEPISKLKLNEAFRGILNKINPFD